MKAFTVRDDELHIVRYDLTFLVEILVLSLTRCLFLLCDSVFGCLEHAIRNPVGRNEALPAHRARDVLWRVRFLDVVYGHRRS